MASTAHTVASQISPKKKKRKGPNLVPPPSSPWQRYTTVTDSPIQCFFYFPRQAMREISGFALFSIFSRLCNKAGFFHSFYNFQRERKRCEGDLTRKRNKKTGRRQQRCQRMKNKTDKTYLHSHTLVGGFGHTWAREGGRGGDSPPLRVKNPPPTLRPKIGYLQRKFLILPPL